MPRLRRSDKRKHEVTIELLNVLANMHCSRDGGAIWERFWGGRAEGRAAFDALRHQRTRNGKSYLKAADGESYEEWLDRMNAEPERDPRLEDDEADDDPEPDEDALPWTRGARGRAT